MAPAAFVQDTLAQAATLPISMPSILTTGTYLTRMEGSTVAVCACAYQGVDLGILERHVAVAWALRPGSGVRGGGREVPYEPVTCEACRCQSGQQ